MATMLWKLKTEKNHQGQAMSRRKGGEGGCHGRKFIRWNEREREGRKIKKTIMDAAFFLCELCSVHVTHNLPEAWTP